MCENISPGTCTPFGPNWPILIIRGSKPIDGAVYLGGLSIRVFLDRRDPRTGSA